MVERYKMVERHKMGSGLGFQLSEEFNPNNPSAPSFPRRRETSNRYTPRSGQNLDIVPLRGKSSINWIPAFAGMTNCRSIGQSGFKHQSLFRSSCQRGFTLIELLIVLVVMGIALGLVMVQLMPDHQAPLRDEAARLALLLENAGLEARASGRSLAWSGEKNMYRFSSKNEYGGWVRIDDDSSFRPRTLPAGVNIGEVSVEEQPIKPGEYVLLSANSFAVPFSIRLYLSAESGSEFGSARVIGKSTGDVEFKLDDLQVGNLAQ